MIRKISNKWGAIPLEVKVSVSYTICSILQKSISFITVPLFTRLLTTEQYGQYTIYSSWLGILAIFTTLNLAYGSFSTAMMKFEKERNEYIASIEGICLFLTGIFCVIYLPFHSMWNRLFELPTIIVVVMALEILFNTSILLWSGKKRFEFKYKSVIAVTLLTTIFAPAIALVFVIYSQEKGYARILGYAAATIIIGGFLFFFNVIKGKRLFSKRFWKYAFGFNIPLLAYYLSQVVFSQSDRIMISHFCGSSDAAMYGVAHNLALVLTFVLNAINNSYVPWMYTRIKEGRQKENKTISCIIAIIMAALLLFIIWFAPEIVTVMAGEKYLAAIGVVPPIAMSLLLLFYTQLFANVEFYFEEKNALVGASIGAALINIVLNTIFIPKVGFVVAGYTTLFSYIIFAICNYFAMKRVLKKNHIDDAGYDMKKLIIIAIVFMSIGFLGMALYNYLLLRFIGAILAGIVLLHYRKMIFSLFLRLKK